MNDRQTAFRVLNRIEKNKAYSNLALDAELRLNQENTVSSAFVTALVYGVLERKITLDYILSSFLKQPIKKLRPEVLTALRLGAYQLEFMDKVPVSAAVNESVKLVKSNGCAYAAGLVNSVLRKVADTEFAYPEKSDMLQYLSIRYSCPTALVQHYIDDYGTENAAGILATSIGPVPTVLRVNTLKTNTDSLKSALAAEGIAAENGMIENTLVLTVSGAIEQSQAYQDGLFHVQDTASALCVQALDVRPGQTVIDVCAAPGGKTFTVAEQMENQGKVLAFDLYPQRVQLIENGAARLGISIVDAAVQDASMYLPSLQKTADRVLCDVPCSGLGTIRRKPEIRYKDMAFIDNLTLLQYNILVNASKYVKEGGVLVYSTCTLNRAENDAVCDRFLQENPDFEALDAYTTLLPHKDGTDGFFFARLGRKAQ
ncbi:MAG: 16S rRNA (cytosine(967)-C(5))-methyltransferase RsmB [Candidatus Fimenecus sp.]